MSTLFVAIMIPLLASATNSNVQVCHESPRMEDFESDCAKTGDKYMCETFFIIYSIAAAVLLSMLIALRLIR